MQSNRKVNDDELTMANAIHASSNPAALLSTNRVKRRRKTISPEMSVNTSTMVFTRVATGVNTWFAIVDIATEVKRRETRNREPSLSVHGLHVKWTT